MMLIAESYEYVMFVNSFNLIPAEISRIKEICCVSIPFGVGLNRSGDIDACFCGPRKMDELIG